MRSQAFLPFLALLVTSILPTALGQTAPASGSVQLSTPVIDDTADADDLAFDPPDADISMRGNGCKPGTVGTVIAKDNSFMTLIFDSFVAEVGPSAVSKKRAFCNVNFTITSPGWTFDVDNVDFRGYYNLEDGVNATIKTVYKFIGQKGRGKVQRVIEGPVVDDFLVHKKNDQKEKIDHPCTPAGGSTTLRIRLAAILASEKKKQNGYLKGDSADGKFRQLLNIGWKKC